MLFLLRKLQNAKTFKIFLHFCMSIFFFAFLYKYFGKFNSDRKNHITKEGKITFFHAFYFSLVTQSTVGFGDIAPKDHTTKIICMSQLVLTIIVLVIGVR
jgi:hypothetical protein